MDYYGDWGYHTPYTDEAVAGVVFGVLGIVFAIALAVGLVFYIVSALGLYKVARARGLENPWLAWVPVASSYYLGKTADHINAERGKTTNYRIWMLVSVIVTLVSAVLFLVFLGGVIFQAVQAEYGISDGLHSFGYGDGPTSLYMQGSGIPVLLLVLFSLVFTAIAVVAAVFEYLSLYQIYKRYNSDNAALFLVLSILFSVVTPFFMLMCGNRAERGVQPIYAPPYPPGPGGYQPPGYGAPSNPPYPPTGPVYGQQQAPPQAPVQSAPVPQQAPQAPTMPGDGYVSPDGPGRAAAPQTPPDAPVQENEPPVSH